VYDLEFGNIPWSEFGERLRRLCQADFTLADLEEQFCGIFPGLVDGMEEALGELSDLGPSYCLSNTNEIHLNYCRKHFPVLSKFTKIYASYEIHKRKPYPGIYRDVAKDLELSPRDLVFFDDLPANIKGAQRAGLEAYLFEGAGQVLGVLKESKKRDDREKGEEGHEGTL